MAVSHRLWSTRVTRVSHCMRSKDRNTRHSQLWLFSCPTPCYTSDPPLLLFHYHLDQVSYLERTKTILHFHLNISLLLLRETHPHTQQSLRPLGRNSEDSSN